MEKIIASQLYDIQTKNTKYNQNPRRPSKHNTNKNSRETQNPRKKKQD